MRPPAIPSSGLKFEITDEHALLRENAQRFLEEQAPVHQLRALRDTNDARGFSAELWKQMVLQGWPGIASSADLGGFELGHLGLGILMECVGRTLSASPLQATVCSAIPWLTLCHHSAEHESILRAAIAGEVLLSIALEERPYYAPFEINAVVEEAGDQLKLTGHKLNVLDIAEADYFIVVARQWQGSPIASGLTAMLVDAETPGLMIQRSRSVDIRHVGQLELRDVQLPTSCMIGSPGQAAEVLTEVENIAAVHAACELLGIATRTFELTCEYLKSREQFGVPIGSFQALQHRAAHLFAEIELSRSVVFGALAALDAGIDAVSRLASAAKAKMCRVSQLAISEAVQMHGGIGVTDELDIGLYLKRAKVLQQHFGGESYHTDRFARLNGY